MKKLKWAFFLVFTILCFTGGVLADRALVGFGEMQEKTWSSDEDSRPVCRNVLRPNFILPVAGMLFNQAPAEALSRSRA
jgi:hypothetical protein